MKISTYYREDEVEQLPEGMREYLDREFFFKLPYVEQKNPKMLVVFAGGNAVGKSTLARTISQKFKGLRIENDAVKYSILQKYPELAHDDRRHHYTWFYTMDLYRRLDDLSPNGLVIRDGTIAWYYDRILPIFLEKGYKLFVIGYDLSEQKMRELIAARGDTPTTTAARLQEILPDHFVHNARFFKDYTPDIILNDDDLFNNDLVVDALSSKLA